MNDITLTQHRILFEVNGKRTLLKVTTQLTVQKTIYAHELPSIKQRIKNQYITLIEKYISHRKFKTVKFQKKIVY